MKRLFIFALVGMTILGVMSAMADRPSHSFLWLRGQLVRTLVPPDHIPNGAGTDPVYAISTQQYNVAGVGPGEPGYHGGAWAVNVVTWNQGVTPYELHSADDVMNAQTAGHITIERHPEADFRCPLQPGGGHGGPPR